MNKEYFRKLVHKEENFNVAIDFDGVIYKNSKGFYDGTLYDDPIDGVKDALNKISKKYNIIIFTAKVKSNRPLVNGKTGTQLVWEWLKEHKMDKYVTEVTAEKPRAIYYIDDKAIKFTDWESTLEKIKI